MDSKEGSVLRVSECKGQSGRGKHLPAAPSEPVGEAVHTVDADGEMGCLRLSRG